MAARLELIALGRVPEVQPGDDLAQLIVSALAEEDLCLFESDVLVVAQKIVSKAERRLVSLKTVTPSEAAVSLAKEAHKDPRLVELILRESAEVVRTRPGVIIVEHRNGYVHANAGIDQSNIPQSDEDPQALLLPLNSNESARVLRDAIGTRCRVFPGIIISDSVGRAWRNGTIGMALGSAGIRCLLSQNGTPDMFGRALRATEIAVADGIAAAACLLMGEASERRPVVIVRGGSFERAEDDCTSLLRSKAFDMFR